MERARHVAVPLGDLPDVTVCGALDFCDSAYCFSFFAELLEEGSSRMLMDTTM